MAKQQLVSLFRDIRLEAGLTQAALAQRLRQSQSYVSKYESGEQRLDLLEIEAICTTLNISLIAFVERYLEG
jgi:transcriptional regulator with XRE-family HTH domain